MLKFLYFYGSAGALTFLDPITGVAVTKIPVTEGSNGEITLKGIAAWDDSPATREFVNIKVGSEGDYHDIQVITKGDADNLTADTGDAWMVDLGDFTVKENSAISGTAPTGNTSGILCYDDGTPEVPIPQGRTIFITTIPTADSATALATTGSPQPNATKALGVNSMYYAKGCTTVPEDKVVQAAIFQGSSGRCACGAPKGRILYPSCPLVIDGNENPAVKTQVQAGTEVTLVWEFVEVPKAGATPAAGTATKPGSSGGSLIRAAQGVRSFLGF
jgi:hypothetical protein